MKYIAALIVITAIALWFFYFKKPEIQADPATYAAMFGGFSDPERGYYQKIFIYAMDTLAAGESYDWKTYSGSGEITAEALFVSKSKSNCRNFTERFSIGGNKTAYEGIACKRGGDEGWCRLTKQDVLTCALEQPAGSLPVAIPSINIDSGSNNGKAGQPVQNGGTMQAPGTTSHPIDTGKPVAGNRKTTGGNVADTVTGTAGNAAGPATGGAIQWFNKTFGE